MIRVGPAGWDYRDWEGIVYPAPRPRGFDRLGFIAGLFDAVEINATFYRHPDPRQAASWARRVSDRADFRFTAKLHRSLTHPPGREAGAGGPPAPSVDPSMDSTNATVSAASYRNGIAPLAAAGRLLAVLMQFPQSFDHRTRHRDHVESLAGLLRGLPLVAEFRHRRWDRPEVLEHLRRLGIGFCNIDQPDLGSTMPPTGHVTSPIAYVRLHGRNAANWFRRSARPFERYDYLYTMEELEPWIARVEEMAKSAEQVVIIANNHYRGKGPANGLMVKSALTGSRVKAPARLVESYPALEGRVIAGRRPPAQRRLF